MKPSLEKRLLQIAVAVAGLIPVFAGGAGLLLGAGMLDLWGGVDLDSHFRYLSGLLLGIGLCYWTTIPAIEREGGRFGLLTVIVVVGGLARAVGMLRNGAPGPVMSAALGVELVVTPALLLWQTRLAKRSLG